jgi:hypothetical protein
MIFHEIIAGLLGINLQINEIWRLIGDKLAALSAV